MLKITIEDEHTEVEIRGSLIDIAAEATRAIRGIYNSLHKSEPMMADFFKFAMERTITDKDSGIWTLNTLEEGEDEIFVHIPVKE